MKNPTRLSVFEGSRLVEMKNRDEESRLDSDSDSDGRAGIRTVGFGRSDGSATNRRELGTSVGWVDSTSKG
jgi:hypothetical protein